MTILDAKGNDPEYVQLANMIGHWLSFHTVAILIHKKKLISPDDWQLLQQGKLDKASAAKIVRAILFDKDATRVIVDVIHSNLSLGESKQSLYLQLMKVRDDCKDLAKASKAGLIVPDVLSQPPGKIIV